MNSMNFISRSLLTVWSLILSISLVTAQEKVERESRIREKHLPEAAQAWFKDAYEQAKRVKWFQEENEEGTFYEAKLKWKKQKHSVKFTSAGAIHDIEIETGMEKLPPSVKGRISSALDSISDQYRIQKLQEQWQGDSDDLENLIDEHERNDLTLRYEIEIFIPKGDGLGYHELHFSESGGFITMRPIRMNTADHLQY